MARKPGGGRKKSKPDYNPSAILQNQMDAAVALYSTADHPSLQTIANELDLNPIKVRKLLITAGVYKSEAPETDALISLCRAQLKNAIWATG